MFSFLQYLVSSKMSHGTYLVAWEKSKINRLEIEQSVVLFLTGLMSDGLLAVSWHYLL